MRKNLLIIFNLFIAISLFSQPKLEIENSDRELGCVAYGSNNEFIYKIKNTGNEPLIITNVNGSNPFYASGIPKEPIMPGKTSKITMKYDTKRVAPIYKTATVYSNSITGDQTIKLKGEVLPYPILAAIGTNFLSSDYIQNGDTLHWKINLTNNYPDKIEIQSITGLDNNFQSDFKPVVLYPQKNEIIEIQIITSNIGVKVNKQLFVKHSGDTSKIELSANFKTITSAFRFKENSTPSKVDPNDTSDWYAVYEFKNIYAVPYEIENIFECKYEDDFRRIVIADYKKIEWKVGNQITKSNYSKKLIIKLKHDENIKYCQEIHKTLELHLKNKESGLSTLHYLDCHITK